MVIARGMADQWGDLGRYSPGGFAPFNPQMELRL